MHYQFIDIVANFISGNIIITAISASWLGFYTNLITNVFYLRIWVQVPNIRL